MISRYSRRTMATKRIRTITQAAELQQTTLLDKFMEKYRQMEPGKQAQVKTYLTWMMSQPNDAVDGTKYPKSVSATFSYPSRGEPNDGNPALMVILDLIPKRKLVVKENEYTKQRAIWLCEDFTVQWCPKNGDILTKAFDRLSL